MACNLHAIEQMQLRGRRRVDGVGHPKFDFHTTSRISRLATSRRALGPATTGIARSCKSRTSISSDLTSGSQAVVRALQVLGSASGRLAADLERTPAVFQALPVTARLAGVLQDLASAGDVLAESLDLITNTLRRPAVGCPRIDDKKRACDRADDQASSTEAELLRGDWRRVERDVLRGEKLRSRGEESDLPRSIAAVVDQRARNCAESRRLAELRRFELARFTPSIETTDGVGTGGSGTSGSLFTAGLPRASCACCFRRDHSGACGPYHNRERVRRGARALGLPHAQAAGDVECDAPPLVPEF